MDFDLLRFPEMAVAIPLRPDDTCGVAVLHECRNTFTPGPPHRLKNYLVVIYDCPPFRSAHGLGAHFCLASSEMNSVCCSTRCSNYRVTFMRRLPIAMKGHYFSNAMSG